RASWRAPILAAVLATGTVVATAEPPRRVACDEPLARLEARCGRLRVAENRARPRKRSIDLHLVVLPALGPRAAPDPVFFLAGRPADPVLCPRCRARPWPTAARLCRGSPVRRGLPAAGRRARRRPRASRAHPGPG